MKYAFLRAQRRITLTDDAAVGLSLEQIASSDFVDVADGIKALLRETASGPDEVLVDERVEIA